MSHYPRASASVAAISGSVYTALAHRLDTFPGERYPLHVGDTYLDPAEGCRMQDLRVEDIPGLHRYASPHGWPGLLDAIVERTRARTGLPIERAHVLVTAGATGGLGTVVGAIVEPGDEVLILAPHWPLIEGIVRSFHGTPIAVPFLGAMDSPAGAVQAVAARKTEKTVALYLSTPNNPTGRVMPRSVIEALVSWARQSDLWIFSDEVYEEYVYEGEHTYSLPLAPERVFSVHSFSKSYGMAGNRCGYVVGPAAVMGELRKVSTHSFYSTATAAQVAAQRVLGGAGDAWVGRVKELYRLIGNQAAARLGLSPPQGSTFLFFDVGSHLDEGGLPSFLEKCVDRGLFVAPGPSFGPYPTHIRVCYTAAPPEVVMRGVDLLAQLLGG